MTNPISADIANTKQNDDRPNIFIIFGSPHRDGYTAELLKAFVGALPGNVHIDALGAFSSKIVPCIDCGICKKQHGCAFDDFSDFDNKYQNADIIVIATPIYNLSVPAPLKSILDRTQQYYNARFSLDITPVTKPKKAVLLITGGAKSTKGTHHIEQMLKQTFSVMNTKITSKVFWLGTDNCTEEDMEHALSAAKREGINLLYKQ